MLPLGVVCGLMHSYAAASAGDSIDLLDHLPSCSQLASDLIPLELWFLWGMRRMSIMARCSFEPERIGGGRAGTHFVLISVTAAFQIVDNDMALTRALKMLYFEQGALLPPI